MKFRLELYLFDGAIFPAVELIYQLTKRKGKTEQRFKKKKEDFFVVLLKYLVIFSMTLGW